MTENLAARFAWQALKDADVAVYLEGQLQVDITPHYRQTIIFAEGNVLEYKRKAGLWHW